MKFSKNYTLQQMVNIIGADTVQVKGPLDFVVTGLNEIHSVEPGDLTFVDHPKYYNKALESAATTIIINRDDVDVPPGKALIISDDPFRDYVKLVKHYKPFIPSQSSISPAEWRRTIIEPLVLLDIMLKSGVIVL